MACDFPFHFINSVAMETNHEYMNMNIDQSHLGLEHSSHNYSNYVLFHVNIKYKIE